jgi:hypothetical protein
MREGTDAIVRFLATYPASVSELATALRGVIRAAIPEASETLDEPDRVVGYSVGAGYAGLVCTIIPSKTGVKLGVVRAADVPDPHRLLEGPGKRHRYVPFKDPADLDRAGIPDLIRAARDAARK